MNSLYIGSTANRRGTQLIDSDCRQICEGHKAYIALSHDQLPASAADKPGLELVEPVTSDWT